MSASLPRSCVITKALNSQQSVNRGVHGRTYFWQIHATMHQACSRYLYMISNIIPYITKSLCLVQKIGYEGSLGLKVLLSPSLACSSFSPRPSCHHLHREVCSGRGSRNAFVQSCPVSVISARGRWFPLCGDGPEGPGFPNAGTSALGRC